MIWEDLELEDLPWQDMHTAPRDGTWVTLLLPSRAGWKNNDQPWLSWHRVRQATWERREYQLTHHESRYQSYQAGWKIVEQNGQPSWFMLVDTGFGHYPGKWKLRPLGWLDQRTSAFLHDYWEFVMKRDKAASLEVDLK